MGAASGADAEREGAGGGGGEALDAERGGRHRRGRPADHLRLGRRQVLGEAADPAMSPNRREGLPAVAGGPMMALDVCIPLAYCGLMPNDRQTALRLPGEALKRAERLARLLKDRPEYQGLRVSTAAVLRLA